MLRLAEDLRAQIVAHAEAGDHLAGDLGRALEVVRGAGCDVLAEELLRGAPAEKDGDLVEHAVAGLEEVVLLGKLQGVAEGAPAADDRDLVHGVAVLEHVAHEGVAALVVGDGHALALRHHPPLLLGAGDDALHGLLHVLHRDALLAAARGEKGALVHEVGEVGAREAGRELGDLVEADLVVERLVLRVDGEDPLAALHVGAVDGDLAVEAAGAQQRRVQDVGAVGRRDQDDRRGVGEAVHLDEQLVQGLLALVVAASEAGAPLASHGVDLVDEHDGGCGLLGLLEQVADAARADADEHLDEVGARDREERHARLAGDGLGEQRLAGSRRADEQHAVRDLGAHLEVALGLLQEVADLLQLLDGLVDAGDVGELDLGARLLRGARALGAAESHLLAVGVVHLAHEVDERGHDHQRRDDRDRHGLPDLVARRVDGELGAGVLAHEVLQRVGAHVEALERDRLRRVAARGAVAPVLARQARVLGLERDRLDAVLAHGRHEVVGRQVVGLGRLRVGQHVVEEHEADCRNEDEQTDEVLTRPHGAGCAKVARVELVLVLFRHVCLAPSCADAHATSHGATRGAFAALGAMATRPPVAAAIVLPTRTPRA